MLTTETIWQTAERMQGEIAGQLRQLLGEPSYDPKLFDEVQRQRRVESLKRCAAEDQGEEERHNRWMEQHLADGWTLGETFDPAAKTHPNLRPFAELPPETQTKIRIFDIVARYANTLANLLVDQTSDPATEDERPSTRPTDEQFHLLAERARKCLSTAFAADPGAMWQLLCQRVVCNDLLADHPDVMVQKTPPLSSPKQELWTVGLEGILTGLFTAMEFPVFPATAYDDERDAAGRMALLGFELVETSKVQPDRKRPEPLAQAVSRELQDGLTAGEPARPEIATPDAVLALKRALAGDDSYAWSWHSNLAVCAIDEGVDHALANRIAQRFMQHAFGVTTREPGSETVLAAGGEGDAEVEWRRDRLPGYKPEPAPEPRAPVVVAVPSGGITVKIAGLPFLVQGGARLESSRGSFAMAGLQCLVDEAEQDQSTNPSPAD